MPRLECRSIQCRSRIFLPAKSHHRLHPPPVLNWTLITVNQCASILHGSRHWRGLQPELSIDQQQTSCTSLPLSVDGTDRRTDWRTPDLYIVTVRCPSLCLSVLSLPHTMRPASITYSLTLTRGQMSATTVFVGSAQVSGGGECPVTRSIAVGSTAYAAGNWKCRTCADRPHAVFPVSTLAAGSPSVLSGFSSSPLIRFLWTASNSRRRRALPPRGGRQFSSWSNHINRLTGLKTKSDQQANCWVPLAAQHGDSYGSTNTQRCSHQEARRGISEFVW